MQEEVSYVTNTAIQASLLEMVSESSRLHILI